MTPTRIKHLARASRLCLFAQGSPLRPSTFSTRALKSRKGKPRARWAFARRCNYRRQCGAELRPQGTRVAGNARGREGCRRATYPAHARAANPPQRASRGGACAAGSSCGRMGNWASGFTAVAVVPRAAPSHARNVASGAGQLVGGRTSAWREEDGAVGGRRSSRL